MDITGVVAAVRGRIMALIWVVRELVGSGFLALLRPDKYARMGLAMYRHGGASPVSGIGLAAARNPNGIAIIDEAGPVTWG
jgi:fatty-acyl-CoA synthase